QMSKLAASDLELDSAETMRLDRHTWPARDFTFDRLRDTLGHTSPTADYDAHRHVDVSAPTGPVDFAEPAAHDVRTLRSDICERSRYETLAGRRVVVHGRGRRRRAARQLRCRPRRPR